MAGGWATVKVAVLVAAVVAVSWAGAAEGAVTCGQVVRSLMPCVSYVTNGGAAVPGPCCSGVKTLSGMAKTTEDRQGVCGCLKSAVNGFSYSKKNADLAGGLPAKCGLNIPYKISPSTDCKRSQNLTLPKPDIYVITHTYRSNKKGSLEK